MSQGIRLWSRSLIDSRRDKERPLIGISMRWWDSYTHKDADWKAILSLGSGGQMIEAHRQEFTADEIGDLMDRCRTFLEKTP